MKYQVEFQKGVMHVEAEDEVSAVLEAIEASKDVLNKPIQVGDVIKVTKEESV